MILRAPPSTIAARWVARVPVTITFNFNGPPGQQPGSVNLRTGEPIGSNLIYIPRGTWPGRGFIGWFKHTETGARVDNSTFYTILVARWTRPYRHIYFWSPTTSVRINLDHYSVIGDPWRPFMGHGMNNWTVNSGNPITVLPDSGSSNFVRIEDGPPPVVYAGLMARVSNRVETGTSLDSFDIVFNRELMQSSFNVSVIAGHPNNLGHFVESVMAHEIGHVIGLEDGNIDRNPVVLGGNVNNSIMNFGRVKQNIRAPQPFDNDSVNWIYQ